jgi:hypothetical protein
MRSHPWNEIHYEQETQGIWNFWRHFPHLPGDFDRHGLVVAGHHVRSRSRRLCRTGLSRLHHERHRHPVFFCAIPIVVWIIQRANIPWALVGPMILIGIGIIVLVKAFYLRGE